MMYDISKTKVFYICVGLIIAGLLATLFMQSQTNQQQYIAITKAILDLRKSELNLNHTVSQYHTSLNKNNNSIRLSMQRMIDARLRLNNYFLMHSKTDEIMNYALAQLAIIEDKKLMLVEMYRQRSTLNNITKQSLPGVFNELISSIDSSVTIADNAKNLLKEKINRVNIVTNRYFAGLEHDEKKLKSMLNSLTNSVDDLLADDVKDSKLLSEHIYNVIEENRALFNLLMQIQDVKTAEQIELIQNQYIALFEKQNNEAFKHQSLLFVVSMVLLVYLASVLIRLQSTSSNLNDTVIELEFRKQALNEHSIASITDIKGIIIYVNDKFCEISQYRRDELIGKNHRIVRSNLYDKTFFKDMWKVIANGKKWQGQICNQAKDGSNYWMEATLIPRLNKQGKSYEYIGICTDITTQKKAEAEVESRARFPMEIPEPIMRVNQSGEIIFHNAAAKVLLNHWHVEKTGRLPSEWVDKIQETLNLMEVCEVELNVVVSQYLLIMTPVVEFGYVNIYGRDITEKKHAEASLSYQSNHDRLTGLVNRYAFEHDLENALVSAQQKDKHHVLLYIDLDQFKVVNDTCGHVAGDALLCQLSNMMLTMFRENDTLARLGGDEFGVLLLNCDTQMGNKITRKLLSMINHYRFIWEATQFEVGASIGLVEINKDSDSIVSLLGNADVACYAAKDAGRNQIKIYNSEDSESVERHSELQWASRIPKALAEDRFRLMVQTIMPLRGDDNLEPHYEILLRMVSEDGDLIPPGVFIPAAERYNLMHAIDHWVVVHVFNFLHDFAHHCGVENLPVLAINLSGESMGNEELLAYIRAQFELNIIPAKNICFEVTETAAISNLNKAVSFIEGLKKLGCKFALDDFGSGLSSFSYLKSLPVDYLKIDGAFVKGIVDDQVDAAMVEAINRVGHIMNIKTIAEFVENEKIMDVLKNLNVDYAQGYHIDKPLPLEEKFSLTQQRALGKVG